MDDEWSAMDSMQVFQSELQAAQTRSLISYRVAAEVRDTAKQQGEAALTLLEEAAKLAESAPAPSRGIDLVA